MSEQLNKLHVRTIITLSGWAVYLYKTIFEKPISEQFYWILFACLALYGITEYKSITGVSTKITTTTN